MKILITGGASGLGLKITELLAEKNHKVYFTYNNSKKSAEDLQKNFSNVIGFKCDFKNPKSVDNLIKDIDLIDLESLINNAQTKFIIKHFLKFDSNQFKVGFDDNIYPVLKIAKTVIKGFKKRKFGRIVTILSSAMINKPPLGWSEYVASKSYLASLVKSWASEYISYGITSNAISPSFMKTNLTSPFDNRIVEIIQKENALKRLLNPKEVAEVVHFLLNTSPFINGQNIAMNEGKDCVGL